MSITLASPRDVLVWAEHDIVVFREQAEKIGEQGYTFPVNDPIVYPAGTHDAEQAAVTLSPSVCVMTKLANLGLGPCGAENGA